MIDSRLLKVMEAVKPNAVLPIIIEVRQITPSIKQDIQLSGASITGGSNISPFVYARASPNVIKKLASAPGITKISYDEPAYPHVSMNPPSLITTRKIELKKKVVVTLDETARHIGAAKMWDEGYTGKGIRIGVIDTGISTNHSVFDRAIKGTFSGVEGETVEDTNGHGSWCASAAAGRETVVEQGKTVVGIAPDADLYALKALSNAGIGQMSWVMRCMEYAVTDFKCDIISMSLGSLFDNAGMDPISRLLNEIVYNKDVLCVVAAGNSFVPMTIGSPGGALFAVTVGATSLKLPSADTPSTFSSKGPTTAMIMKPDIAAPGGNLISNDIAELILGAGANGGYTIMAGSSMATPQVAGAFALMYQAQRNLIKKGYTREYAEQIMQLSKFPSPKDPNVGYGVVDIPKMHENIDNISPQYAQMRRAVSTLQVLAALPASAFFDTEERRRAWEVRMPAIGIAG